MLKNIIALIEEETGFNASEPTQRAHIIKHVNLAASRLHESTDLEGSCRADDFNLSVGTSLVSFPPHVGQVRKMRYSQSRLNVEIADERGRFHQSGFNDAWDLAVMSVEYKPLARDIEGVGKLKFVHPDVEDHDVRFVIIGSNDKVGQISEVVTLTAGQTSAQSKNVYGEVVRLLREDQVNYDTQILDLNDTELATFPANFIDLKHNVVRIGEIITATTTGLESRAVEVYYKKALTYMYNDYDCFVCDSTRYDECLAWEYIKCYGPSDKYDRALANLSKLLTDIGRNEDKGKARRVDAAPNHLNSVLTSNRRGYYKRTRY